MSRIHVYKLTTDNGGAPAVKDDTLSLAICKPAIRKGAGVGDLVFGFLGRSRGMGDKLIYVAKITEKSVNGDYYSPLHFKARPDQIYLRQHDGAFVMREGAEYHQGMSNAEVDLGKKYTEANVILSSEFRYFGDQAPVFDSETIANLLGRFTQNCINNSLTEPEMNELQKVYGELLAKYPERVNGNPIDQDHAGNDCNECNSLVFTGICNQPLPKK